MVVGLVLGFFSTDCSTKNLGELKKAENCRRIKNREIWLILRINNSDPREEEIIKMGSFRVPSSIQMECLELFK